MELYIVCALIAIALGIFIFKGILFTMFLAYSLRGEDLKWNRSPSLPLQKYGSGSIQRKTSDRASNYSRSLRSPASLSVSGSGASYSHKARPMPPIPREKQSLSERIPLEIISVDDEDDFDSIRPVRPHHTSTPMHQLQYQSSPRAFRPSSRTSGRTFHSTSYQVYPSHELPSPSAASGHTDPYGTIV